MGKLLCEKNLRDVWCRNEIVRAEIGQILQTHATPLVVYIQKGKCTSNTWVTLWFSHDVVGMRPP